MEYCEDALRFLGIEVLCGSDCPLLDECPRLILEDAADEAIEKAIIAITKIIRNRRGCHDKKDL